MLRFWQIRFKKGPDNLILVTVDSYIRVVQVQLQQSFLEKNIKFVKILETRAVSRAAYSTILSAQ
jgi:hypothetical protein